MTAEFLAEPDEAEHAADHYMKEFEAKGVRIGQPVSLVVNVSQIQPEKMFRVEHRIRELYDCVKLEKGKTGFIFKKPSIRAHLSPIRFERANLLSAAKSLYRLILDEEVTVSIEKA